MKLNAQIGINTFIGSCNIYTLSHIRVHAPPLASYTISVINEKTVQALTSDPSELFLARTDST